MSEIVYEASLYTRTVRYKNYKKEEVEVELSFALDPLQLLAVIANFKPKTNTKSGNPAKQGALEFDEAAQINFIRDLAAKAAGTPTEDGETWIPMDNFLNDLAGKAFLTQLAASDGDRQEFAQTVILDPFRSFVGFAAADPSNSKADVQEFNGMLAKLERVFAPVDKTNESVEDRRARLEAEMAALNSGVE